MNLSTYAHNPQEKKKRKQKKKRRTATTIFLNNSFKPYFSNAAPTSAQIGSLFTAPYSKRGHEWLTIISSRNRGTGCPFCNRKKISTESSLLLVNPKLATEWHPTKNGTLDPGKVFSSSATKVWWRCAVGHEWQVSVNSRSNKSSGCPYCSGHLPTTKNNLLAVNPKVAAEWHPAKNGELGPQDVLPSSNKKIWWICSKEHEWQASPSTRSKGHGCGACYRLSFKKGNL